MCYFCICCLFVHILTVYHCELSWQPLNRKYYCTLWYGYSVKALCVSNLAFKDPNHHKNEMVIIIMPTTSFVFIMWLYFSSSGFPVSYIENILKQLHRSVQCWSYVQSPINCTCSTTRRNWECYDKITSKSCPRRCQLKLNSQRCHKISLIDSTCVPQKLELNCCMCEKIQWYWAKLATSASLFCVWTNHAAKYISLCSGSCLIEIQRDTEWDTANIWNVHNLTR